MVPEEVPAHHGDERGVETAEEPHPLIEDAHVVSGRPVTVVHGDRQSGEAKHVGPYQHRERKVTGRPAGATALKWPPVLWLSPAPRVASDPVPLLMQGGAAGTIEVP